MEDNKQPLTEVEIYNKWINKSVSKELEYSIKQAMNEFAKPLLEEIEAKNRTLELDVLTITNLQEEISKLKEEKEVNDVNFERISTGQKQDIAALEISLSLSKKENLKLGDVISELTEKLNFLESDSKDFRDKFHNSEVMLTSVKEQLVDAQKTRKMWYDNWHKILDAFPRLSKGCRDCADENGTCPISKLPCDPTDAVIAQFNKLEDQNQKMAEALESIDKFLENDGFAQKGRLRKIITEALLTNKQKIHE